MRTVAIRYCAMSRGDDREKDLLHIGWHCSVWDAAPLHCYRLLLLFGVWVWFNWALGQSFIAAYGSQHNARCAHTR